LRCQQGMWIADTSSFSCGIQLHLHRKGTLMPSGTRKNSKMVVTRFKSMYIKVNLHTDMYICTHSCQTRICFSHPTSLQDFQGFDFILRELTQNDCQKSHPSFKVCSDLSSSFKTEPRLLWDFPCSFDTAILVLHWLGYRSASAPGSQSLASPV
jgi:hypothetical protein